MQSYVFAKGMFNYKPIKSSEIIIIGIQKSKHLREIQINGEVLSWDAKNIWSSSLLYCYHHNYKLAYVDKNNGIGGAGPCYSQLNWIFIHE